MGADIRAGLRIGAIFGSIVIFLTLIGFSVTAATIISGFQGEEVKGGTIPDLLVYLGIMGLWAGSQAAKNPVPSKDNWGRVVLRSVVAGGLFGLLVGISAFLFAAQRANQVDVRTYLAQMSPQAIDLFTLQQSPGQIILTYLGFFTAVTLAGGLLFYTLRLLKVGPALWNGWNRLVNATANSPLIEEARDNRILRFILLLVVILLMILVPRELNNSLNQTLGTVGIYVLIGLGLNIVVGLAGLLDLGYVVFFAVGAYSVALLTAPVPHDLGWSFWAVIPVAVVLSILMGILLGVPVLRLRGDYLAIVTLGFGEIIRVLIKSDALTWFTNGPKGVPDVGAPVMFGEVLSGPRDFLYMIFVGVLLVIFVTERLQHSRVGRAWVAMREDETVAQAMGINTLFYKLLAFGIGAAFAAVGGVLFASRNQFTGPEEYTLLVSINVLALVIVGGMGSIPGVILGALVIKGIPEFLREIEQYRIITFGALLVVMMILRPQGLWPSARRRMEMHMEEEPPIDEGGQSVMTAEVTP